MHPKTGIRPNPESIQRILSAGWVGQLKIHGHRAQIHLPASADEPIMVYNRQGKLHGKILPEPMKKELWRIFRPAKDWTVLDAEWLKPENKLYVFDVLRRDGETLRHLTYQDRWSQLPRAYLSPHILTLPLLRDLPACLEALKIDEEHIEGLVFKALNTTGFLDSSIIRCRRLK